MSTAETVKAQLQADIAAANATTGKADATMHDAVVSLIEGFGDGEVLPEAAGLSDFPEEAYSVNGADLTAVGEAIAEKAGVEKSVFPDGWKEAVEGIETGEEPVRNMISDVLSLVPMFDDTWKTAKFTLTSNKSEGKITVPNPLGAIPSAIYVLKLDIDYSIIPQVIGGYNVGNITEDNGSNRTIALFDDLTEPNTPKNLINDIHATNWNFTNATAGASTAEVINIRAGDRPGLTLWLAGEYILAVK